jgi:putative transposase
VAKPERPPLSVARSRAERWVKSVKEECLSRLIPLGEPSPRRALQQYTEHYHAERNHQGKDRRTLFPSGPEARRNLWEQCGVENDW